MHFSAHFISVIGMN